MRPNVRRAITSDIHGVVELIQAYAHEVFERNAEVTPEALLDDGFGSVLEFFVAESAAGDLIGYAAWEKTYDVILGRRGGALLGLFVHEHARGNKAGDTLLAAVAREVRAMGGTFLVGLEGELPHSARLQEASDVSPTEVLDLASSLHPAARRD
jgi:N-acetylglutamate synthase-like GNAT family acetyltransferase